MDIHIGCSGWFYDHWINRFYPGTLKKSDWLDYYSQHFTAVEINSTFYNIPKGQAVRRWFEGTPDSFRFVVKGNNHITHDCRLHGVGHDTEAFHKLISGLSYKLKLVLWQFPPSFTLTRDTFARLESFCAHLKVLGQKSVFEFRDISWFNTEVLGLLNANGTGYVLADAPDFYRRLLIPSSCGWIYIRKHGRDCGACYSYTDAELTKTADYIRRIEENPEITDLYVMFNNDGYCNAVRDAIRLKQILSSIL
ncbi:MAG: DUF72 domain-containing protein [Eubacteriales bacterium]